MSGVIRRTYGPADAGEQEPFALGHDALSSLTIGVHVTGEATLGLEWTLDDVNEVEVPLWFPSQEIPAGTTATVYAYVPGPWLFGRINLQIIAGSVTLFAHRAFTIGARY